jgi:hypothetical protein
MDHAHHGPGDDGLGELRDEFSEGLEDEELEESLDHGKSKIHTLVLNRV